MNPHRRFDHSPNPSLRRSIEMAMDEAVHQMCTRKDQVSNPNSLIDHILKLVQQKQSSVNGVQQLDSFTQGRLIAKYLG